MLELRMQRQVEIHGFEASLIHTVGYRLAKVLSQGSNKRKEFSNVTNLSFVNLDAQGLICDVFSVPWAIFILF